jgi:hypothetical protein
MLALSGARSPHHEPVPAGSRDRARPPLNRALLGRKAPVAGLSRSEIRIRLELQSSGSGCVLVPPDQFAKEGSTTDPREQPANRRSQTAFGFGARDGVTTTWTPSASKTVSKAAVHLASRSDAPWLRRCAGDASHAQ